MVILLTARLITFEGIDGSGKTSVIDGVKGQLESKGFKVLVLREPGTTKLGEHIRELIKSDMPRHQTTDLFLFIAARNDMVQQVIIPSLKIYDYILLDRYTDSTLAYQGYGLGYDINVIRTLQLAITKGAPIDKTIYLDVDIETAKARRASRVSSDKYEMDEFLTRVKHGYEECIRQNPDRFIVLKNKNLDKTIDIATKAIIHQTKSDAKRVNMSRQEGETITVRAEIGRFGRDYDSNPTILLRQVKQKYKHTVLTDHVWTPYTREFVKPGMILPGDLIEFTATVTPYTKLVRGEQITEYGFGDVKDVKIISAVSIPKDIDEDWHRMDLTYIHAVTVPEVYKELLSKYVGFVSAMSIKYLNNGE